MKMIVIKKRKVSMGYNYSIIKDDEVICMTTSEKNAHIVANAFKEDEEEVVKFIAEFYFD